MSPFDAGEFTRSVRAEVAKHDARVPEQRAGDESCGSVEERVFAVLTTHLYLYENLAGFTGCHGCRWQAAPARSSRGRLAHRRHVAAMVAEEFALADHRGREAG